MGQSKDIFTEFKIHGVWIKSPKYLTLEHWEEVEKACTSVGISLTLNVMGINEDKAKGMIQSFNKRRDDALLMIALFKTIRINVGNLEASRNNTDTGEEK